jgi:hypothetical protein
MRTPQDKPEPSPRPAHMRASSHSATSSSAPRLASRCSAGARRTGRLREPRRRLSARSAFEPAFAAAYDALRIQVRATTLAVPARSVRRYAHKGVGAALEERTPLNHLPQSQGDLQAPTHRPSRRVSSVLLAVHWLSENPPSGCAQPTPSVVALAPVNGYRGLCVTAEVLRAGAELKTLTLARNCREHGIRT